MRLTMVSFQPLLKPSKPRGTTSKAVSMRSSRSMTTTTSVGLWIRRARALDKPGGLKSSHDTTFRSIIVREKPIGLLMLCLASPREVKTRRIPCELRILGSYTVCSLRWPMPVYQASWPMSAFRASDFQILAWHLCTKCLSVAHTPYCSYANSGILYEATWPTKGLTRPALVVWGWGCRSCRRRTNRSGRSGRKDWNQG